MLVPKNEDAVHIAVDGVFSVGTLQKKLVFSFIAAALAFFGRLRCLGNRQTDSA
jgi:hypothetical protein